MPQQSQPENPDGNEFPIFTEFTLAIRTADGVRVEGTASLVDILNAVKPANATMGHAIGVLLQYCDAPLEPEPIDLVVRLLRAAISKDEIKQHAKPPISEKQARFDALPQDDRIYCQLVGRGFWVPVALNGLKTQSEWCVMWCSVGADGRPLPHWGTHFYDEDLCQCQKTWKGDIGWAELRAQEAAVKLNAAAATPASFPPNESAMSQRLTKKPHLLEFIRWENCLAHSDGRHAQPNLEVVPCTEASGGAEEADSRDDLVDDSLSSGVPTERH